MTVLLWKNYLLMFAIIILALNNTVNILRHTFQPLGHGRGAEVEGGEGGGVAPSLGKVQIILRSLEQFVIRHKPAFSPADIETQYIPTTKSKEVKEVIEFKDCEE